MQAHTELASSFRWAERINWHEAVGNHFSLALDEDGRRFLMYPNGSHFALIRASDLLLLDAGRAATSSTPYPIAVLRSLRLAPLALS